MKCAYFFLFMGEVQNQIKLFEFTEEEENDITETCLELTNLICQFIAEGVRGIGPDTVTLLDIIGYIIGEERTKSLNFAMITSHEENGRVSIDGYISEKSRLFLTNLLQYQLDLFAVNIPLAVEYSYKKYGSVLLEKGMDISAIGNNDNGVLPFPQRKFD